MYKPRTNVETAENENIRIEELSITLIIVTYDFILPAVCFDDVLHKLILLFHREW